MNKVHTNHPSWLPSGKGYSPKILGLKEPEVDFLKGYLNGHHDNNYLRVPGCPSSSGTDTVVRHCVATATLPANGSTSLSMAFTGIPEAPIICNDGTTFFIIPYSNCPNPVQTAVNPVSDFLKASGVGEYRCVSYSVRIDDLTAPMYRKGAIMAVRNPSAVDLVPVATAAAFNGLPIGTTLYSRVVDYLPTDETAITSISSNNYIGPLEEGLYAVLPYQDPLNPFIKRDCRDNKAVYSISTSATAINTVQYVMNVLGARVSSSPNVNLILRTSGVSSSFATNDLIACSKDNMQSLLVRASGMDPVNGVLRVSVMSTWEYITATNGTFADLMKPPMKTNLALLQAASEVFRAMPAAYKASANGFDEIWTSFKKIYGDYVEPVARSVISNLPPQYAPAAGVVKGLLDTVTDVKKDMKGEVKEVKSLVQDLQRSISKSGRR